VVVYFHGGGFVFGSIDSFDEVSRLICETCRVVVVSVDYPLAPEHRFPVPFLACVESVDWVKKNIAAFGGEPDAVLVMGDSAGANLAAATALECADRDIRLAGQVIVYGTLVHTDLAAEAGVPEWADRDQQFGPTLTSTTWYWTNYAENAERARHPRASVLLERDMSKAPPALVTAGSLDTFCEEGRAYARRLSSDGVDVHFSEFAGVAHGYIAQGWWPEDQRDPRTYAAAMETLQRVKEMAHK
jgi:acetyl esterase